MCQGAVVLRAWSLGRVFQVPEQPELGAGFPQAARAPRCQGCPAVPGVPLAHPAVCQQRSRRLPSLPGRNYASPAEPDPNRVVPPARARPGWGSRDPPLPPRRGPGGTVPPAGHTAALHAPPGVRGRIQPAPVPPDETGGGSGGDGRGFAPAAGSQPLSPCLAPCPLSWLLRRTPAPAKRPRQTGQGLPASLPGCPAGKAPLVGEAHPGTRRGLRRSRRRPQQPRDLGTPGLSPALARCARAHRPRPSAVPKDAGASTGGSGTRTLPFPRRGWGWSCKPHTWRGEHGEICLKTRPGAPAPSTARPPQAARSAGPGALPAHRGARRGHGAGTRGLANREAAHRGRPTGASRNPRPAEAPAPNPKTQTQTPNPSPPGRGGRAGGPGLCSAQRGRWEAPRSPALITGG